MRVKRRETRDQTLLTVGGAWVGIGPGRFGLPFPPERNIWSLMQMVARFSWGTPMGHTPHSESISAISRYSSLTRASLG